MIETAMYIALGFLSASLLGLAILPSIYKRAVRLTQEAMKAINPTSYAEVQAVQDLERAQHALALRRVEQALDDERQNAATYKVSVGKLTADHIKLKTRHAAELVALREQIESTTQAIADEKTAALNADLDKESQKLNDTEQALAAARAESDVLKAHNSHLDRWLPAEDTMALATITGLEAQLATLKSKLLEYEVTGAPQHQMLPEFDDGELKAIVKELEVQLVDTETKFISAQAEVARLSMQLDSVHAPKDETLERFERDLKWAETEKARLTALTLDRERSLTRARGQIHRLRQDILAVPEMNALRADLKSFGKKISASTIQPKSEAKAQTAKLKSEPKDPVDEAAFADKATAAKKRAPRKRPASAAKGDFAPSKQKALQQDTANPQESTAKKSSDTAAPSPASDLVNRIVKSSLANTESKSSQSAPSSASKDAPGDKDKKRDVA